MSRQPFLPKYKDAPVAIGASQIEQLPKVAELVGRIVINWSGVDVQLSLALGSLLGVENTASVAVFNSLKNHRAQRDALRAAADYILDGEIQEIFDAILIFHEELDKQRNAYVHGIWGISDPTPDGIVWSSVQAHANMLISDYHAEKAGHLTYEFRLQNLSNTLFVVKLNDLEELNDSIKLLDTLIGHFHAYLRYKSESAGYNSLIELQNDAKINSIRSRRRSPSK